MMRKKNKLLLLIEGKAQDILQANNINEDEVETIKVDEKNLAQFKFIRRIIMQSDKREVYFGTIENELQRFHVLMKWHFFRANISQGAIIDSHGNKIRYTLLGLFLVEIPKLLVEMVLSGWVVVHHYIKLPIMRRKFLRKYGK